MTDQGEELDQKLAGFARRTVALRPRSGFDDRVMRAIRADSALDFRRGLIGASRKLLPVATLAAVLSLVWAVISESSSNATLAVSDDPVELAW